MKYFDYAAATPLDQEAAEIYVKAATEFYGNTQSLHDTGSAAAALLENARKTLATLLGVDPGGLFFTSGGSESNLLLIRALLAANPGKGRHIVTSMAEHSSVANVMNMLENEGYEVSYLPFEGTGRVSFQQLEASLREDTVLVSIQHGNSEIGTLQPVKEIGQLCRQRGILFHSDFVQTFGKTEITEAVSAVDAFSLSGHKFYGPKGVGAAYLNPWIPWRPYIAGTTHEKGFRPGTVNLPGIIAMTAAAQKAVSALEEEFAHLRELRKVFAEHFSDLSNKVKLHGLGEGSQLPGIVGMQIHGLEGQWVMLECNRKGYGISTGSACHTDLLSPAKTMIAMGIGGKAAKEFFRVSFGRQTTMENTIGLARILREIAQQHCS
ncbi:cysteine desulfurase [Mesobacillus campisalis]|uniref:Cysteine desulfurase n=1 Tax=Mesobacillus campisalis TaxID=1408103 RepID=A0A0M2SJN5_9BACI|nr:IscS subfamily cysteine desulfurase [Mesobacillus campisalis]KKK33077.1 cysteine desulfurase [Mesobacillus campisalis]